MEEIAPSIGTIVVECLVKPALKKLLRPIFCFKTIVDENQEQCRTLNSVEVRLKDATKQAENNCHKVYEDVEKWFEEVKRVTDDAQKLQNELGDNRSCCFSTGWTYHFCFSKKVWDNTESIKKLCERGKSITEVAHPVEPRQCICLPKDFVSSKSGDSAFEAAMKALRNDDVKMIGLHGMGGIGKTTLAKHIIKEAQSTKIFDHAVLVTISQTPNIRSIQGEIAHLLGLSLPLEEETDKRRADKLYQRLKREKILIILDDVWETFDLSMIGILEDECKGCKILLTTRLLDVCTSMECQTTIKLDLLREDEAWEFFRKKAGLSDNSNLNDVAKQIVGKCGGLPIALATIGSAMRNKSKKYLEHALKYLRDARIVDIHGNGGDENAYKCLRLSYDYLKHSTSGEAQFLLLLCSLFPEDHKISVEDLTRCAFGMGLFERADSVHEARGAVGMAVHCLIDSCLLLGNDKEGVVTIHDMVRDVALWIGETESPEGSVFVVRDESDMNYRIQKKKFKNCRAVSFMPNSISKLPNYELDCSKLEIMLIFSGNRALDLSDASFFKNTTALKVLDVRGHEIKEKCDFPVPQALQDLTDLRTVNLRWCRCFNSSFLGKLKNLEILAVIDSEVDCAIEEVFREMKKLKLLDLSHPSSNVINETLSSNVIKGLSDLKELYTYPGYSFGGCKSSDDEGIVELCSIPKLDRLNTRIVGWRSLHINFCFPNLKCYSITVAERAEQTKGLSTLYDTVLLLDEMEQGSQLTAFKNLFPTVEYLQLQNLRLGEGFKNIIPCWVNASKDFLRNLKVLRVLNSNELEVLFKLKYICKEPRRFFPCNLTHLIIKDCQNLKAIFSSAICIAPSLQQLQVLFITFCAHLEEVISATPNHDDDFRSCFQNLEQLKVYECGNLKSIFPMHMTMRPHDRFHLPKLQQIYLQDNDKLEHVFDHEIVPEPEHVFDNEPVAETEQWPSLEYLSVRGCPKLSLHFAANIQTQLQAQSKAKQLRTIKLGNMKGVDEILQLQRQDENDRELLTFHLKKLELDNVEDLKCVWSHAKHNICFSYLTQVKVSNCNKLKQLFMMAIAPGLIQLKQLEVLDCDKLEEIVSIDNLVTEEKGKESVSDDETNMISLTFPQLKKLKLKGLPSLIKFCPPNYNLVFPSLARYGPPGLKLEGCPQTITDFFCSQRVTLKGEKKPQIM